MRGLYIHQESSKEDKFGLRHQSGLTGELPFYSQSRNRHPDPTTQSFSPSAKLLCFISESGSTQRKLMIIRGCLAPV